MATPAKVFAISVLATGGFVELLGSKTLIVNNSSSQPEV